MMNEAKGDCFDVASKFPIIWDSNKDLPQKIKDTFPNRNR